MSPQFLKAQTLGDRLKAADPRSRVVSVAGKDRAAIMMGGHFTDQIWFWSGKSFATLKGTQRPTPTIVEKVNGAVAQAIATPETPSLPQACHDRSKAVSVGNRSVGVLQERKAGDWQGFRRWHRDCR